VFVHHLRLAESGDLDRELGRWLAQSYSEYGSRTWLASRRATGRGSRSPAEAGPPAPRKARGR
jgi:hypothetical protein